MSNVVPFGERSLFYRLDENNVPRPISLTAFLTLPDDAKRDFGSHVGDTYLIDDRCVKMRVSTVFLAVDYNHFGGTPILFETMIFGGKLDGSQWRYRTYEEAAQAHEKIVQAIAQEWRQLALPYFTQQGA